MKKNKLNLNKLVSKMKEIDKKKALIVLSALAVIIILIVVLTLIFSGKEKTMTCTREQTLIDFKFEEELMINLEKTKDKKDNKKNMVITGLSLNKSVTIGSQYNKYSSYDKVMLEKFKAAYGYLPEKTYKIDQKDDVTTVTVELEESGLILDNFNFTANDPNNKFDITFNHSQVLESSTTAYKIGDEYTEKTLKVKLEGLGYTCK